MKTEYRTVLAAVCIISSFVSSLYVLACAAFISLLISYRSLSEFRNVGFYIFMIIVSFIPAYFLPAEEALSFSAKILLRMIAVYGGFVTLAANINFTGIKMKLTPLLGDDFSKSLALSINLFPSMRRDLYSGWAVLNLNSCRRLPFLKLPRMAVRCAVRNASETAMRLRVRAGELPEVFIIKGPINSGKTTMIEKLAAKEVKAGNRVYGIIAKGVYNGREKTGYNVTDISTGEIRQIASTFKQDGRCFKFGRFYFSESGFEFAKNALLGFQPGGVVFLDEVGPLELKGKGYADCLKILLDSDIKRIYLAVREECLIEVRQKYLLSEKIKVIQSDYYLSQH